MTGTLIQKRDGIVQWQIKRFSSVLVDGRWYCSPEFYFARGEWQLWIRRVSLESGRRIDLYLRKYGNFPPILDVEYTFCVLDKNGHKLGEQRNRKKFGGWCDNSPDIPIELHNERMSDLVPGNTLTVLCHIQCIHPTRRAGVSARSNCSYCGEAFDASSISSHQGKCLDKPIRCPECSHVVRLQDWHDHQCHGRSAQDAAQLKEKLQRKIAELAEKQSELVRSQRLIEELSLKVIDLETNRDNAQKLLETQTLEKMLQDFEELMQSGDCSDVIIRVKEENFRLHRNILSARSPYFHSMFRSDMKEKSTGVVEIGDCEPDIFRSFIHFLYTGKAEELSPENVHLLYAVADKYQEKQLKDQCLQFMVNNMSESSFCDFIAVALKYNEQELLQEAVRLFTSKGNKIARTVKWQNFVRDCPTEANELFIKALDHFMK